MAGKRAIGFMAATLLAGAAALPAMGQAAPGGNGQGQQDNNGQNRRQRFDPSQMRQRIMERLKEQLGASDDDFKALEPKIEHVMQLEREANAGRFAMFRRPGQGGSNGPNGQSNAQENPVQQKASDLQAALDNKDTKPEDLKAKLDAYRQAKAQAQTELTSARQDLRGLLTQRQEAVLVMMGVLD